MGWTYLDGETINVYGILVEKPVGKRAVQDGYMRTSLR
jgi:hypothetical protein